MTLTKISQAGAKDEAINEAKIQISNAGTNGQYLQKSSGTGGLTWATVTTDLVADTSPQLGGDLDVNGNDIISSTTNQSITIDPNGTGSINLQTAVGGITSLTAGGDVQFSSGVTNALVLWDYSQYQLEFWDGVKASFGSSEDLEIWHDATDNQIKGNNGKIVISTTANNDDIELTPHGTGDVVIDGLKYPQADGSAGQVLKTDGSAQLSWTTPSAGPSLANDADNRVITGTGSGLNGEANLIFDGTNLGVGCTPSRELHVKGLDVALRLESTAATGRIGVEFYDTSAQKGFFGYPSSSNDHMAIQQNEAADFYFYVNGAERLRINSSGYIAHHDSNIVTDGFGYHGWSGKTQILDSQGLAIYRADDAWGGSLQLASSRGTYASASASLAGDRIGGVYFCAHDGTNLNNYTSAIESYVTGTVASDATPGYLTISTAAAGSNQLTERLRVENDGDVKISDGDLVIGTAGHGIDFSATSSNGTSELFDDYEEGTWTPDPHDGTCSVSNARYIRVGNVCHIWALCDTFSDTTTNDQVGLTGIPFTPVSNGVKGSAAMRYADDPKTVVYFSSTPRIHFYGGNTANYTQLRHNEINSSNFEVYFHATYDVT